MSESLRQLLREADATASIPAPMSGLADQVRRRRARRTRIQRVGAGLAVVSIVAATWATIGLRKPAASVSGMMASTPTPAADRALLASLALEAKLHALTAKKLSALQALRGRNAAKADLNSVEAELGLQRDRAALILIYDADRSAREHRPADAIAAYRRTLELFPQSTWAQVARQRLKAMDS